MWGGEMGWWATPPPGLPGPEFPRDGDDLPVVPRFLMALPLYARVLALLSGSACWLQRRLSAPGPLLLQRIESFVDRVFRVAEDFALGSALDVICLALCEFAEPAREALLHLNTSPKPSLAAVVPEVVQRGLGAVGSYRIPGSLWRGVVPAEFLESGQVTTWSEIRRAGRVGCRVWSVSFLPLLSIWAFSGSSLTALHRRFFLSLSLSRPARSALYCLAWG